MKTVLADVLPCPSCSRTMAALCVPARPAGQGYLGLDFCMGCRGIWFDPHESTRLAPAGILELFKVIRDAESTPTQAIQARLACPRCQEALVVSHDVARSGPFAYHRCPRGHGRFTTYAHFLTEKGFVRHIAKKEVERIAVAIGQINCHACGGPIDLRRDTACPHCRSPIAVLDTQAMAKAFVGYSEATVPRLREIDGDLVISALNLPAMPAQRYRSLLDVGIGIMSQLLAG